MVNGATVETVKDAMVYAWQSGVKGITIYRDGSRNTQVLDNLIEEDEGKISCPSGVCEI
jgi:ribonucleoside-diphosphate reductase alpha chain